MRQLFLDGHVYKATYDPPNMEGCTAYAHIYYGTEQFPEDQFGRAIYNCHNDDGISLEEHLRKNVLPLLNKHLEGTDYIVLGMDRKHMIPEPLFIIARRDGKQLADAVTNKKSKKILVEAETAKIEKTLLEIIASNNEKVLKKSTKPDNGFFARNSSTAKSNKANTPRSTFRPR